MRMRAVVLLLAAAHCRAPETRPTAPATRVEVPPAESTESASPSMDASVDVGRVRSTRIEDCCRALADAARTDPAPLSIYRLQFAASCDSAAKRGEDLPEFVERATSRVWVGSIEAGTVLSPCVDVER